jgi:hypothetical protein
MGLPEEVGPKTEEFLLALANVAVANVVSPPDEVAARDMIVSNALNHFKTWGGKWDPAVDKLGPSNLKIAGKFCSDTTTRARQGGAQMYTIFSVAGHPQAMRCLTISEESVKMYNRPGGYSAKERNNTDICSWCGIFALYIYKISGLRKMPAWDDLKVYGVSSEGGKLLPKERCQLTTSATPKKGDIGVIGAREVKDAAGNVIIKMGQNHHFIVTDVKNGSVDSVDGNAGASMEILTNSYQISNVLKSGGFYTPIWENCR